MKDCGVKPKRFVRYDENGIDSSSAVGVDETV